MDLKHADKLSHAAIAVLQARPTAYRELVPRRGGATEVRGQLQQLRADDMLAAPVRSREDAEALLAGAWLWHDFLDESHTISQGIHTPSGSFWHAIMHRREGDYSNAKYWYARCRKHPAFDEIHARVSGESGSLPDHGDAAVRQMLRGGWDPDAFVDLVSGVEGQKAGATRATAVRIQQIEWAALFDHCIVAAAGA